MSRRKKHALLLGVCALGVYLLHFGWFHLFGPPDWYAGVRERAPEMSSVRLGSEFDRYLEEYERPGRAGLVSQGSVRPEGVLGRIVREDRLPGDGPALLQTRDDSLDHVYWRRSETDDWREIGLPAGGRTGEARWIREGESFRVLIVVHRPWWPLGGNYGRFWVALSKAEARPESGLYLLDLETGESRYLFAGAMPLPSPDRRAAAFVRSERQGLHSLHLWRAGWAEPLTVVSLWEASPGSGPSFHWTWSSDSDVLFVRGTSRGSRGSPAAAATPIRLLYDIAGDRLVELK